MKWNIIWKYRIILKIQSPFKKMKIILTDKIHEARKLFTYTKRWFSIKNTIGKSFSNVIYPQRNVGLSFHKLQSYIYHLVGI